MSGHSKWSTIKRQTGASDAKRGQIFTKLSNAITLAVKSGGGVSDPESNFKLRLAVDRARGANMPKENIDRAILRAKGLGAGDVQEFLYEGFAPGGVALMVEAVTDNKQRTVSTLKAIFDKNGGTLGSSGSVSYLFERRGQIVVKKDGATSDEFLDRGINAGISDMEEDSSHVYYFVEPANLAAVKRALEEQGVIIENAELLYVPINYMVVDRDIQEKILAFIDKLDEVDDVQQVYSNLELSGL